jgi:hypothetical protein
MKKLALPAVCLVFTGCSIIYDAADERLGALEDEIASQGADPDVDPEQGPDDDRQEGGAGADPAEQGDPPPPSVSPADTGLECFALDGGGGVVHVVKVDADTGATSDIAAVDVGPLEDAFVQPSAALFGDELYFCSAGQQLTRVDLNTEEYEHAEVSCGGVANYDGKILLMPDPAGGPEDPPPGFFFFVFDSFDDVVAGAQPALIEAEHFATRMTVDGDRLYTAWHSTDFIDVHSLPDGELLAPISLEGHDDWIDGLAINGGVLRLHNWTTQSLISFDVQSGERLGAVPLESTLTGLACRGDEAPEPPLPVVGDDGMSSCLSISADRQLVSLDLETGEEQVLHQLPPFEDELASPSLALIGHDAFFCTYPTVIERVNVVTGASERADLPCHGVANFGGRLLVMKSYEDPNNFDKLFVYDSFDDVEADAPSEILDVETHATRLTVAGNKLYAAWHSTDYLEVRSLPDGAQQTDLVLEGHDDWIDGLSVNGDVVRVYSWGTGKISSFDVDTGTRLADVQVGWGYAGLACR